VVTEGITTRFFPGGDEAEKLISYGESFGKIFQEMKAG